MRAPMRPNLPSLIPIIVTACLLAPFPAVGAPPAPVPPRPPGANEAIGVLAVADPPGPGAELVDLTRTLRSTLAERSPSVLAGEELRLRMSNQARSASLSELDRAYAGAVAAYQAGDYEGAARALRAVVDDLEVLPESEEAFSLWSRAVMRLSRTEGSLGRKGEARELMERLLRSDPTAKADPELYPPSFAKQLEEARAVVKAMPRRKLTVTTGGKAARVYVAGRDVGPAPFAGSLAAGRYRVSAVLGDLRIGAGVVDLSTEDQTVTLDFTLAEVLRPDAGPGLALPMAQRTRGLIAAGGLLKLDRVLTASVGNDGDVRYLVGTLYDVRRGMLQREGRLRLDGWSPPSGGLMALSGFLFAGEPSSLVIATTPGGLATRTSEGRRTPTSADKTKGWLAVGGGALALGLGTVAVVESIAASGKYSDARGMLDNGSLRAGVSADVYDRTVRQGDQARAVAIGTGAGAAVAAVASGVLGYLAYKQTGEVGPFRF